MHWARILDVNVNRLNESLKFIEDLSRFSFENKKLLAAVRKTRTEFLEVKKALPLADIIAYRESRRDLGRAARFDLTAARPPHDVIIATITRAKEAARTIEEILKSQNAPTSVTMKEIRFEIYDLEKDILRILHKTFSPRLYAIIDEQYLQPRRLKELITLLENNGATMIQLRIKTLTDRQFLTHAITIRKTIHKPETKFIINDRVDIARACHADGVHLGQHDMPVKMAREILGEHYIVGASAHTLHEAKKEEAHGADYIGVGSVYRTKTKADARICGLAVLRTICKNVNVPVIGIGGITGTNYRAVLKAGATGIAVSSYLFEGDIRKNIRTLTRTKL